MKKIEEKKSKIHIITEPQEAFKNTFKYFFEERIWKLAKANYDENGFNLINFN